MRLDTTMSQRMDQRMILAPRMIQSMEILQLPIMALQERISQELEENVVLETQELDIDAPAVNGDGTTEEADVTPESQAIDESKDDALGEVDQLEEFSREWEDRYGEDHRPSRGGIDEEGDRRYDAMQNMPSRPQSLQDYLTAQLTFMDLEPSDQRLVRYMITHIDENGFLRVPLEEIIQSYEEPVTSEKAANALEVIQELDPPGVGARDLKECLLLQITPEMPLREVLRTLITNHLEDLRHNRMPVIQKKAKYDLATINEAKEVLKRLTVRPGAAFSAESIPYVVPDIAVDCDENGEYQIRLLDDWTPNIYISRRYLELYRDKGADPKAKEYLKRKIQSAQWLMESIEQRRNTLEKVTRAVIKHQKAFLDKGPEFIEPLKMQQIADDVGVHVTTVSRAVDDKWVQTPRGILPLKRFFGGGTQTASGEEVAWETIKLHLLDVIGKEDKSNPLSDEDLMKTLNEAGYPVKRRTITKYRKMLNIPSSRQRKDWTIQ